MKKLLCYWLSAVLISVGPLYGQQQASPPPATTAPAPAASLAASPAPAVPAAPAQPDASGKYTLKEGEDVMLRFAQDLSSKTATEGDPVVLSLDEDLKVGGVVVVKAGSKAYADVTKAEKSGMLGKAGQLNIRLTYLKAGDAKVKLRGTKGKEGESGTTGMVVLTVLFGPLGLIKHGKNVEIQQGTPLKAFVAEDIVLPPAQ